MSTLQTIHDPCEALANLMECLVLSFELSRERCRFTLVCDYPFELPTRAHRAFIGFVFEDVRDFAREQGNLERFKEFQSWFDLRSTQGGVVIQSIKSKRVADGGWVELWFGYNFGGLQFRYGSVTAYRRDATAKEVRGEWLYRDAHSQEEFDFYEPFPDLMDP